MLRRLYPHPWMTLFLILLWMLIVNRLAVGSLVMAVILATAIPLVTSAWWPDRARIRDMPAFVAYVGLLIWDIIVANIQVARIVLFMPTDQIRSAFIAVPLDITSPEAISVLSGTITLTPGTVTCDMSECGRVLLIHSLHAPDPDAIRDDIKTRYEARLKRIFA